MSEPTYRFGDPIWYVKWGQGATDVNRLPGFVIKDSYWTGNRYDHSPIERVRIMYAESFFGVRQASVDVMRLSKREEGEK